ncbi:HEAT repeat domain-containing protein [Streptomyces sp. NPDC004244]
MGKAGPFVSPDARGWEDLLTAATVALDVPKRGSAPTSLGTGFFVTPEIVATCAHVVSDHQQLPESVLVRASSQGREWQLEAVPERFFRNKTGLDLALLQVRSSVGGVRSPVTPAPVWLGGTAAVGDELWTYGHPGGSYRAGGQPAAFTFEGVSRRSGEAGALGLPRLHGTAVGGGYSGSAVVNRRTGAVCGMLCTSNKEFSSSHLLPATEILARCPEAGQAHAAVHAYTTWLLTLSDAQLHAGGVRFPGPELRAYLDAAARAAEEHPYPGVASGGTLPPLSAVYVQQRTGRAANANAHAADDAAEAVADERDSDPVERRPAMELFDLDGDCLLTGAAGAGKSTLLRRGLTELAQRWQGDGTGDRFVPVRVSAAELDRGPLHEAIAAGVRADLDPLGLWRGWTADFFREAPVTGARWLVLVDGLDELVSVDARNRVLGRIAASAARTAGSARFVVSTRPLPESELTDAFSDKAVRLTLLPFETQQLTDFATAWFTAVELPDPAGAATAFTAEIARVRLDGVVTRTPLMATMLCQLYIAAPGRPLPAGGRFAVYQAFLELLLRQQYTNKSSGLPFQVREALAPWGQSAESAADGIQGRLPELIGHVALARYKGDTRTVREIAFEWSVAERPREFPQQAQPAWNSMIEELLRRSGVFVQRGDGFEFQHQTFVEFLAAQRIAADEALSADELGKLFGFGFGIGAGFRLVGRVPDVNSFSYFLIAAWGRSPRPAKILRRLAGHYAGARFIAAQVQEGADPGADVVESARATLRSAAAPRIPLRRARRVDAARALVMLGYPEGADLLAELAKDTKNRAAHRVAAAAALTDVGDPRGPDLLEAFVHDAALGGGQRVEAAARLLRLAHPKGAELLGELATDPNLPDGNRVTAAVALADGDDPRGTEFLGAQAADPLFEGGQRLRAAKELARFAASLGRDALMALAADIRLHGAFRVGAAKELTRLHDPRAQDAWAGLAGDGTLAATHRVDAAHTLQDLGDPRGNDLLAALAALQGLDADQRIRAAAFLSQSADPRGNDALSTLAASQGLDGAHRIEAATTLARFGDPRGGDTLAALATSRLDGGHRIAAAMALADLGDPRGADLLVALASSKRLPTSYRVDAAQALIELGDVRGPDTLAALASDSALDPAVRIRAALLLDEAGDSRGIAALHVIASAGGTADTQRIAAAEALARLGDPRGARILATLADDTGRKGGDRVDAAKALDRQGDTYGRELLNRFAADTTISRWSRLKAQEAVANPLRRRRR